MVIEADRSTGVGPMPRSPTVDSTTTDVGSLAGRVLDATSGEGIGALLTPSVGSTVCVADPSSGWFRFVVGDHDRLLVTADGYGPARVSVSEVMATGIVRLTAREELVIRVVDGSGHALEGASVELLAPPIAVGEPWIARPQPATGSDGRTTILLGIHSDALVVAEAESAVSAPTALTAPVTTVVCARERTGALRAAEGSGTPASCEVELLALGAGAGVVFSKSIDPDLGPTLLPAGDYVVMSVVPGRIASSPAAGRFAGPRITIVAEETATLQLLAAATARAVRVVDAESGAAIEHGTAVLQRLSSEGWQDAGPPAVGDGDGHVDLSRLFEVGTQVDPETARLRFFAEGFADAELSLAGVEAVVHLRRAARPIRLEFRRDGEPYEGCLVVRKSAPGERGPLCFAGDVDAAGIRLDLARDERLAVHRSIRDEAPIAAFDASASRPASLTDTGRPDGASMTIELPAAARVTVHGCASATPALALRCAATGDVIAMERHGQDSMALGLFPGEYALGPAGLLHLARAGQIAQQLVLGPGDVDKVGCEPAWNERARWQGHIDFSGGLVSDTAVVRGDGSRRPRSGAAFGPGPRPRVRADRRTPGGRRSRRGAGSAMRGRPGP